VLREHLASQLADEYVVDTAANGREALTAVMRALPTLIVTDIVMPDIDGIELLKTLRSARRTQTIPVLLISGRAPDAQRIEGFNEGADGYLAKPYTERELRAYIRSMVQSARWRQEAMRREAHQEAEAQLREADRCKDEFLAILGHELRNPLAPLRNGLEILKLSADPALAQTLGLMDRQLGHLTRLVDDLLDINRISRGKLSLQRQDVPLRAVLQSAIECSRAAIDKHQHRLTVQAAPSELLVNGDPDRLAQIFSNLLINSAKYTNTGGDICVSVDRDKRSAVVHIQDNGIGIPPAALERVFDMFSQVRLRTRTTDGLGIGLALVRKLVQMHGGSVRAFSDGVGKGSRFSVRLPIAVRQFETMPGAS